MPTNWPQDMNGLYLNDNVETRATCNFQNSNSEKLHRNSLVGQSNAVNDKVSKRRHLRTAETSFRNCAIKFDCMESHNWKWNKFWFGLYFNRSSLKRVGHIFPSPLLPPLALLLFLFAFNAWELCTQQQGPIDQSSRRQKIPHTHHTTFIPWGSGVRI